MTQVAGGCVSVVGGLLLALGLVFLLAARTVPGVVMMGLGGAMLGFALSRMRAAAEGTPAALKRRIAVLAASSEGEVTLAQVTGMLGVDAEAAGGALEGLVSDGVATVETEGGDRVYVFPGLREKRKVKRCPFCGNEYPVNQPGRVCPSCGGNLTIGDER